jgi:hypothetical protein
MASNFPSSLDTFTNPSSSDAMDSVSVPHATQHSDLNDAVEALQAKVGADSSGVASSHDYKIAALEAISHGKILQVATTRKTDRFSTSSATPVAVTGLSVSITPSSTSSKVLVLVSTNLAQATVDKVTNAYMYRDSTDLGEYAKHRYQNSPGTQWEADEYSSNFLDTPATTSAITYQVYLSTSGTGYVNGQNGGTATYGQSAVTVMEVSA